MNILGISAFYHDSAACLVRDGVIIAAAQEERFTRKKHDSNFPIHAINWCLKEGGINAQDLDYVSFYDKPWVKFERILETFLSIAPSGIDQFLQAMPLWLKEKLWIPEIIQEKLKFKGKILFCGHHESHAASAFFPSPFRDAAILTMDGVGEWETASYGTGEGNNLSLQSYLKFPHSLGLLYSAFTYFTGFRVNSGEYKLMGLAPYGRDKYSELILKELVDLREDGSLKLNMRYFDYCGGLRMTNSRFDKLFGGPARKAESKITEREMDIAASIQKVTEEAMLRMARHVHKVTGKDRLCLAGGVSLNCVGNGRILREGPFKQLWIQPASGDAGGALGCALFTWYKYAGNPREASERRDSQQGSLLGTHYDDDQIEKFLQEAHASYRRVSREEMLETVAEHIAQEKVIGWFQGRMEFGPRALGSRSIIGDARSPRMQTKMNLKIKFRESFRPFAPSVLREHVQEWFEMECDSPYMLLVAPVREDKKVPYQGDELNLTGFEKLKANRSLIPAVTHVDFSARVQTVAREDNEVYYDLIQAFFRKTGCPVIINTSFNVRGEPLVCTPQDAYKCFMRTEIDYLVMGNCIVDKMNQQPLKNDTAWKKEFELD
jgi:carbamoyltransferase